MQLQQARFLTSAAKLNQFPPDQSQEIAFAGRSNAGKSTALNVILGVNHLAHTSKMPGRTQMINFFTLGHGQSLVDLPGYGYAKISQAKQQQIEQLLSGYLQQRQSLMALILLMDIRHPLRKSDYEALQCVKIKRIPIHILLTKADKLSRHRAQQTLFQVRKDLQDSEYDMVSVQIFSSLQKTGIDQVRQQIIDWFQNNHD